MIRNLFLFIFLVLLFFGCDTESTIKQPGKNYFLKYYGGDGNQTAVDLIVNTEGNSIFYYILGNSTYPGKTQFQKVYLAKVNELGEVVWQKTFGEVAMDARDIELTSAGTLAVVANKATANPDILFRRFDLNGNPLDSAILFMGSSGTTYREYANSLTELSDGSFIIEGRVEGNVEPSEELHLRYTGNPLAKWSGGPWAENLASGAFAEGIKTFQHGQQASFYTFGNSTKTYDQTIPSTNKFWAYNLGQYGSNSNGSNSITDDSTFIYSGNNSEKILSGVTRVQAGGFLLVGVIKAGTGSDQLKVAITNSTDTAFTFRASGVHQDKSLGNLGTTKNPFVAVYSSVTNYNFILANTYYNTKSGLSDILLHKVDNSLVLAWSAPVQFGGDGEDTAAAVSELPDGHIIVLGTMNLGNPPEQFKIVLMKLNSSGMLQD